MRTTILQNGVKVRIADACETMQMRIKYRNSSLPFPEFETGVDIIKDGKHYMVLSTCRIWHYHILGFVETYLEYMMPQINRLGHRLCDIEYVEVIADCLDDFDDDTGERIPVDNPAITDECIYGPIDTDWEFE